MTDNSAGPGSPDAMSNSGLVWLKRLIGASPARLNLALQGGGAHGSFIWGVLDTLLENPGIEFEGLGGSSAGAMNEVIFADGWMKRGSNGARKGLADF